MRFALNNIASAVVVFMLAGCSSGEEPAIIGDFSISCNGSGDRVLRGRSEEIMRSKVSTANTVSWKLKTRELLIDDSPFCSSQNDGACDVFTNGDSLSAVKSTCNYKYLNALKLEECETELIEVTADTRTAHRRWTAEEVLVRGGEQLPESSTELSIIQTCTRSR